MTSQKSPLVPVESDLLPESPGQVLIRAFLRIEQWLFSLRLRNFSLLVIGVAVLQNGLWPAPNVLVLCHLSSNLSRQMTQDYPGYDFLYGSPLNLIVGNLTGVNRSLIAFALFHLGLTLAALAGLTFLMWKRFGDTAARLFLLTFAATPLSTDLFTWLGVSDVYVFILSTLLVLTPHARLALPLAILLGWAHFEQGAVIVTGLAAWHLFHHVRTGQPLSAAVWRGAALLGGVWVAHVCANRYYAAHGFHFFNTRLSLISSLARLLPQDDLRHFQTLLFSFHGCYWLVIAVAVVSLWPRDRPLALALLLANGVVATVAFLVIDETRDFSVIVWPLLVLLLRPDVVQVPNLRSWVVAAFLLGLVVPHLIVWGSGIHSGTLFYDAYAVARVLSPGHGITDVPGFLMLPFR